MARGWASRRSAAERVTYLLEPKNWIIVTVAAIGWRFDGAAGLGWGLVAALFAAVLPTLFITRGITRGRWDDRNVGDRRPRLIVLSFITASVALGVAVLAAGGAPRQLTWYFGCMLASVALLALITTAWKISIHCAVASGAVTILSLLYGPWVMPGYALVALVAWSRVELRAHTKAQVIAGTALGAAAAIATWALIKLSGTHPCPASRRTAHPRWPPGHRTGGSRGSPPWASRASGTHPCPASRRTAGLRAPRAWRSRPRWRWRAASRPG